MRTGIPFFLLGTTFLAAASACSPKDQPERGAVANVDTPDCVQIDLAHVEPVLKSTVTQNGCSSWLQKVSGQVIKVGGASGVIISMQNTYGAPVFISAQHVVHALKDEVIGGVPPAVQDI